MAMEETEDAAARTRLASERTQLAWWRTGLTALAVALAIGRVVPELADSSSQWPYTAIGVGFALYGIVLIAYGTARARQLDIALSRGGSVPAHGSLLSALTVAGIGLGVATAVLIVVA
jgi:putative membrane protein